MHIFNYTYVLKYKPKIVLITYRVPSFEGRCGGVPSSPHVTDERAKNLNVPYPGFLDFHKTSRWRLQPLSPSPEGGRQQMATPLGTRQARFR